MDGLENFSKHAEQKRKFVLKDLLFVLPSAFTLAGVLCGFYAIMRATTETSEASLHQAALAIIFAGFFDMFDGRVARLTQTQSAFGVQLDSLADAVSFGVAPAILVYKWALWPLGSFGFFISFVYIACGLIRLARFNVLAASLEKPSKDFIGLPIPIAAAMLTLLVIAHFKVFGSLQVQKHYLVFSLVSVLSLLMISNVRYWSFKDAKVDGKVAFGIFLFAFFVWFLGAHFPLSAMLASLLSLYILAGLGREIYQYVGNKYFVSCS